MENGAVDAPALLRLAEWCERAEGPDRELDEAIAQAVEPSYLFARDRHGRLQKNLTGTALTPVWQLWGAPAYTASLDAALTLVPPNSHLLLNGYKPHGFWNHARVQTFKTERTPEDCKAATLPLARCAAALRARAAE